MKLTRLQSIGGCVLIGGALLFAVYSIAFILLLPLDQARHDFTLMVNNPHWTRLAVVAFVGLVLMLFGFGAVYSRMYSQSGVAGLLGFVAIEIAYLLQACKVTWEACLYPSLARHAPALLRDGLLRDAPAVQAFRTIASLSILLGIVLFCAGLFKARIFPKTATVAIFLGALLYAVGPALSLKIAIVGILTLAAGCGLLGAKLLRTPASSA